MCVRVCARNRVKIGFSFLAFSTAVGFHARIRKVISFGFLLNSTFGTVLFMGTAVSGNKKNSDRHYSDRAQPPRVDVLISSTITFYLTGRHDAVSRVRPRAFPPPFGQWDPTPCGRHTRRTNGKVERGKSRGGRL